MSTRSGAPIRFADEVADALHAGQAVFALEGKR